MSESLRGVCARLRPPDRQAHRRPRHVGQGAAVRSPELEAPSGPRSPW